MNGCHSDGLSDPAWSAPFSLNDLRCPDQFCISCTSYVIFPTRCNQPALNTANLKATIILLMSIFVLRCSNVANILFCKVKWQH